jgi:hypothetical protein
MDEPRRLEHIARDIERLVVRMIEHLEARAWDMLNLDFTALSALGAELDALAAALASDISTDVSSAVSSAVSTTQAADAVTLSSALSTQVATDQAALSSSLASQIATDQADAQSQISTATASLSTQVSSLLSTVSSLTGVSSSLSGVSTSTSTSVSSSLPPPPALAVSPASVASGVGQSISTTLVPSGGTAPYTFSSSLADVTVNAGGEVSGAPTSAETGTITVTDSSTPPQTATVAVTIAVAAPSPLTLSPPSISSGVGQSISVPIVASGGTPPYTYASGLGDVTVTATGEVAGAPAAAETGAITVTDSSTPPQSAEVSVTIS